MKLKDFFKLVESITEKHSPEILIGIGITGFITSVVLAIRATPKAMKNITDNVENKKPTKKEIIKYSWKYYIPTAVTAAASTACVIGGNTVNLRRNAALATAYKVSETALKEYKTEVDKKLTPKEKDTIRGAIAQKELNDNPVNEDNIIVTGKGTTLCYDSLSGRYFKSDINFIKNAVNSLNKNLLSDGYLCLNDFYYELGLDEIGLGEEVGWNVNRSMMDIDYSSKVATNGTPCLVLNYTIVPRYDYED